MTTGNSEARKNDETPTRSVGVERLVIPTGAEAIGSPPKSFRYEIGQPTTVGELREILSNIPDEQMLMFRNGPLPTFYLHTYSGDEYIEFD